MNIKSSDIHYIELINNLRQVQKVLVNKISLKVYEYKFLI